MKMVTKMILSAASKLPPFPQAAQKVIELLQDPDVGVDKLVEVVKIDPSLTADVLKAVNSPLYGLLTKVDNLSQALTLLGNQIFSEIVFTSASAKLLGKEQPGYDLEQGELWQHSLATALMTQIIAQETGRASGPALYTAALLHDIGKVVISSFVGNKYQEIKDLIAEGQPFLEAERKVLGLDHAELGARMAKEWHFSEEMINLIQDHHHPERNPEWIDLAILYVANVACQMIGLGGGADGVSPVWDETAMGLLDIKEESLQTMMADLRINLDQAESVLTLSV
jgi:putative nucleotidyltransferase with HDIG domain